MLAGEGADAQEQAFQGETGLDVPTGTQLQQQPVDPDATTPAAEHGRAALCSSGDCKQHVHWML